MKNKTKLTKAGQAIVDQLTGLNKDDLVAVIQRSTTLLKALGGNPHTDQDIEVEQEDWLLDGIYYEFVRIGRKFQLLPRRDLPGLPAYKHYRKFAPAIRAEIDKRVPDLNPPQKIALSRLLAQTFFSYVSERTELTMSTVLWRIEQYVAAIDHEFPGYLDAGLLRVLVTTDGMGA